MLNFAGVGSSAIPTGYAYRHHRSAYRSAENRPAAWGKILAMQEALQDQTGTQGWCVFFLGWTFKMNHNMDPYIGEQEYIRITHL